MYMRQKMNVKKLIALIAALAMLLALTACRPVRQRRQLCLCRQHLRRSGEAPGR